jgi:hypothetical protein
VIIVDSVEGVARERRQSFVDKLQVEELHGLGCWELKKCSGARQRFLAVRKKAEKEKKNRGLRSSKKGEKKRKRKKEE